MIAYHLRELVRRNWENHLGCIQNSSSFRTLNPVLRLHWVLMKLKVHDHDR